MTVASGTLPTLPGRGRAAGPTGERPAVHVTVDGYVFEQQSRGGISRVFHEILPRMCDADEALTVSLLTSGRLRQALPVHARIRHVPLFPICDVMQPERVWAPLIPAGRRLVQAGQTRGSGAGIWHSTYYTSPPAGWKGPRVVTVYDLVHEEFAAEYPSLHARVFRREKRRSAKEADLVICISEATRQAVLAHYGVPASRTRVVPLAASAAFGPEETVAPPGAPSPSRPFLLYVGQRGGYKSFGLLLEALAHWPGRRGDRPRLVAVGGAWSRGERRAIGELGLAEDVAVRTSVDDAALAALYRAAAAFVYPSLAEGFGIPLLEALACGCRVVASRIAPTVEVAGELPYYFAPGSAEDLGRALGEALAAGREPGRVAAGLARAALYSWDATARGTLEAYHALS